MHFTIFRVEGSFFVNLGCRGSGLMLLPGRLLPLLTQKILALVLVPVLLLVLLLPPPTSTPTSGSTPAPDLVPAVVV